VKNNNTQDMQAAHLDVIYLKMAKLAKNLAS